MRYPNRYRKRREVYGFIDMGQVEVPVPLAGIALTDLDDGTVWALQVDDTEERVKLVEPLPSGFRGRTYDAEHGPAINTPYGIARLLVRDGHLGYELEPDPGYLTRPVYAGENARARPDKGDAVYEIVAPDGMQKNDALAYETEPDL